MFLLIDPFFWFCVFAVIVPPFWVGHNQKQTIEYFSDPFILGFTALTLLVIFYVQVLTRKSNIHLSSFEVWRARWYLLNGIIIHALLDGCIGGFKVNKTLASQYFILDKRYADKGPGGLALESISIIELVVYMPVCIWLYWAYYKGKSYRASLEVFVSSFQLYGTLVYWLSEHLNGYKNFTWVDWNLEFSLNHLFYFWFAVVVGIALWIIVPLWLIIVSLGETQTVAPSISGESLRKKMKKM